MFPYFVLGYLSNKYGFLEKVKGCYTISFFVCGLLFFLLLLNYTEYHCIYVSGFNILNDDPLKQLYIDSYRFLIGFAGSAMFLLFIYFLYNKSNIYNISLFTKQLILIGSSSLGIYCVQEFYFVGISQLTTEYDELNVIYLILIILIVL